MTEFNPAFEIMHPSQKAVVFVDDEADGGMSQKMMLFQLEKGCRERGLDLKVFTEPKRALEFIVGNAHNNIVMMTDNNMPEMSGAELIYALAGQNKLPQTVLFSGLVTDVGALPEGVLALDRVKDGKRAVAEIFDRVEKLGVSKAPAIDPVKAPREHAIA